ncbi:dihydrodipicolinate synthase family protein [Salicibibacter cibarius]|uniref:Dihydrodipicolinate synthase family protein n=1 Tax=Salicibibacter cibarius TaxID=2743000 RepID=A0A7T6Z7C1_9BACI|nr:dihydrodipicolinate synthase family protein [Salicibibacter cibarius]
MVLPTSNKEQYSYELANTEPINFVGKSLEKRKAYAASHVVADPLPVQGEITGEAIDWEATLNYRHYLWEHGFGVAEAMDTAQRGMGLDYKLAKDLIARSAKEAHSVGGDIASGVGTDQLDINDLSLNLEKIEKAYLEQCEFVEKKGSKIILMSSRALAQVANKPEDYRQVYGNILSNVKHPVILHWLGEMFDPNLQGYWGWEDLDQAMEVCLSILHEYKHKIDGIKISLLDENLEIKMRRLLPEGVFMYTGDDFNYPSLIKGDEQGFSHALLGIFNGIAPVAAKALQALDRGDIESYDQLLEPTVPLARHIFQTPTFYYKSGLTFLAFLNGHQNHFKMLGGHESARSTMHYIELFKLADRANLLRVPDLAIHRMKELLSLAGLR